MNNTYTKLSDYIQKSHMLANKKSILAAVSGGADSMCMLDLLLDYCKEHNYKLGVVHVNHGFREESVKEAEYVSDFCKERSITFYLRVIAKGECPATEESARNYRYRLLDEVADKEGYDVIALAHNANDRAETMIFNMIRGSGLTGMVSIRPIRDRYIRPVLCLERNEIEEYLNKKNISFCTDKTNLEDEYSRNKIRHHILPCAQQINTASIKHINEISEYMAMFEEYMSGIVDDIYGKIVKDDGRGLEVAIEDYKELDPLIRGELIRKMIMGMTPHLKDITSEHISMIDGLIYRDDNARVNLPYSICAYREYEKIYITNVGEESLNTQSITKEDIANNKSLTVLVTPGERLFFRLICIEEIEGDIKESIPRNKYTKWMDYDKISGSLEVRSRRESDYIIIDKDQHKKKISRIMIEEKIPERVRERLPVVCSGGEVLWVVGIRDSFKYRIDDNTKTILEMRWED